MTLPGDEGVKKTCCWMSAKPLKRSGSGPGMLTIGTIVRAIKLMLGVTLIGITGWKFRLKNVRSPKAPPELKLNWNGRLMRSPTGF
jgi:hypothetical protein